jgi:hypothetical protein
MSYLREVREDIQGLKDTVETVLSSKHGGNNVNTVRIEGAGSIWNGLAVGIALGAVIVGGAWIISTQQRLEMIAQQSEAYSKAVYMLAPRFAEEIDKELDRQKEPKP